MINNNRATASAASGNIRLEVTDSLNLRLITTHRHGSATANNVKTGAISIQADGDIVIDGVGADYAPENWWSGGSRLEGFYGGALSTSSSSDAGPTGDITLISKHGGIRVRNLIQTRAYNYPAGNVILTAKEGITVDPSADGKAITTRAGGNSRYAGNITLEATAGPVVINGDILATMYTDKGRRGGTVSITGASVYVRGIDTHSRGNLAAYPPGDILLRATGGDVLVEGILTSIHPDTPEFRGDLALSALQGRIALRRLDVKLFNKISLEAD